MRGSEDAQASQTACGTFIRRVAATSGPDDHIGDEHVSLREKTILLVRSGACSRSCSLRTDFRGEATPFYVEPATRWDFNDVASERYPVGTKRRPRHVAAFFSVLAKAFRR